MRRTGAAEVVQACQTAFAPSARALNRGFGATKPYSRKFCLARTLSCRRVRQTAVLGGDGPQTRCGNRRCLDQILGASRWRCTKRGDARTAANRCRSAEVSGCRPGRRSGSDRPVADVQGPPPRTGAASQHGGPGEKDPVPIVIPRASVTEAAGQRGIRWVSWRSCES